MSKDNGITIKYTNKHQTQSMITQLLCGLPKLASVQRFVNKKCKFSDNCPGDTAETEIHFLLMCPMYAEIRQELIAPKYYRTPSMSKFCQLMCSTNGAVIRKLALFIHKALHARKLLQSAQ